ncbi:uro-adherence factor A-like [Prorops nasuta]|uniref:uro-adherence factor A-like n=1 Tax=Prorops nasuta TaxID=863751 RepID=UPI0034CE28DA
MPFTKSIGWKKVPNTVNKRMVDSSLMHDLVPIKKILRRTKVLNKILQYSTTQSYEKYVDIKKELINDITDDIESDDGSYFSDNDYSRAYESLNTSNDTFITTTDSPMLSLKDKTHSVKTMPSKPNVRKKGNSIKKQASNNKRSADLDVGWRSVEVDKNNSKRRAIDKIVTSNSYNGKELKTKEKELGPSVTGLNTKKTLIHIKRNLNIVLDDICDNNDKYNKINLNGSKHLHHHLPLGQSTPLNHKSHSLEKNDVLLLTKSCLNKKEDIGSNKCLNEEKTLRGESETAELRLVSCEIQSSPELNQEDTGKNVENDNSVINYIQNNLDQSVVSGRDVLKVTIPAPLLNEQEKIHNSEEKNQKQKASPKIMSTEIVNKRYKIIHNENEGSIENKDKGKGDALDESGKCIQYKDEVQEDVLDESESDIERRETIREDALDKSESCIQSKSKIQEDTLYESEDNIDSKDRVQEDALDESGDCTQSKDKVEEDALDKSENCIQAKHAVQEDALDKSGDCTQSKDKVEEDALGKSENCIQTKHAVQEDALDESKSCIQSKDKVQEGVLEKIKSVKSDIDDTEEEELEDNISISTKKRLQQLKRLNLSLVSESSCSEDDTDCFKNLSNNNISQENILHKSFNSSYEEIEPTQQSPKKKAQVKSNNVKDLNNCSKNEGNKINYIYDKLPMPNAIKCKRIFDEPYIDKDGKIGSEVKDHERNSIRKNYVINDTNTCINIIEDKVQSDNESTKFSLIIDANESFDLHEDSTKSVESKKKEVHEDQLSVTYKRPSQLNEFIEQQETLIKLKGKPSFTMKDLCEDDQVFILNLPSKILLKDFCGEKVILKEKSIKIGKDKYKASSDESQIISLLLNTGQQKSEYKIANIQTVRSITLRYKLDETRKREALCNNANNFNQKDDISDDALANEDKISKKIKLTKIIGQLEVTGNKIKRKDDETNQKIVVEADTEEENNDDASIFSENRSFSSSSDLIKEKSDRNHLRKRNLKRTNKNVHKTKKKKKRQQMQTVSPESYTSYDMLRKKKRKYEKSILQMDKNINVYETSKKSKLVHHKRCKRLRINDSSDTDHLNAIAKAVINP